MSSTVNAHESTHYIDRPGLLVVGNEQVFHFVSLAKKTAADSTDHCNTSLNLSAEDRKFSFHCSLPIQERLLSLAESLDIPAYALKRLMNHKMSNDVTAGYVVADVERLRKPMQLITYYILKCMGPRNSAKIINIQTLNYENTISI